MNISIIGAGAWGTAVALSSFRAGYNLTLITKCQQDAEEINADHENVTFFPGIKIPQMGWNQVHFLKRHPIFEGVPDGSDFYFVHSYHPDEIAAENSLARTTFGSQNFVSAICRENLVATQFHLEKSGDVGLRVLENFSAWSGVC